MKTHGKIASSALLFLLVAAFATALLAVGLPSEAAAAEVSGTIHTIDLNNNTINIKMADDSSITLKVKSKASITRNSARATFGDLALQDNVTALYKASKKVAYRIMASGPVLQSIAGNVNDVAMGSGKITVGAQKILTNAATRIARNGLVVSLSKITNADTVVVHIPATGQGTEGDTYANDVVADGPDEDEVKGTISAINGANVTITPKNGTDPVTVIITANTNIEVDGKPAAASALFVGQEVEAQFDPTTMVAYSIEADSKGDADSAEVKGIVAAVDAVLGTLTITPDNGGPDIILTVNAATEVEVDGEEATLNEVEKGMPVKAEYDATTLIASEVKAGSGEDEDDNDSDAHVDGIVSAVGNDSVTILPDGGGAAITLTVSTATEIEVNGEDGTLADIVPGQPIEAEYYLDTLVAKELKAGTDNDDEGGDDVHIKGTVSAVTDNTVTITPDNGAAEVTLTVTSSTQIEINGEEATIADIQVGVQIRAQYHAVTLIAEKLEVGSTGDNEENLSGVVAAVTSTSVTIQPDNGSAPVTLTVTSETDIEVNGENATIADIQVNDPIQAEYNPNTLVAEKLSVGDDSDEEE